MRKQKWRGNFNIYLCKTYYSTLISPSKVCLKSTPYCLGLGNMHHGQKFNSFLILTPTITEFITFFQTLTETWTIFSGYCSVYFSSLNHPDYLLFLLLFSICFGFWFCCGFLEIALHVIKNLLCFNFSENGSSDFPNFFLESRCLTQRTRLQKQPSNVFYKKLLSKISQYSQESTYLKFLFIKVEEHLQLRFPKYFCCLLRFILVHVEFVF